ncbi:MAG: hypothetical protein JKX76_14900 [Colwellia sp.]|nr:hypothetical protein [Colwellia sp.]
MKIILSEQATNDIEFINGLSQEEILSWPIDYEVNRPTTKEVEETLDCWFGGSKWRGSNHAFLQFGQDGCGSLFCLWFYPDLQGEPPVIFLGSEGERSIVANNCNDFVKQVASGKVFCDGNWLEPEDEDEDELDWDLLKQRAKSYLGEICDDPNKLRDLAISRHPNLSDWVESNVQ